MEKEEKDFKERFGLEVFVAKLTKGAAAYDEDRHWEVNEKRYEKKQGDVSEHEFMNRNRFLAGRMRKEPIEKEAFTAARESMEKIAAYYSKK